MSNFLEGEPGEGDIYVCMEALCPKCRKYQQLNIYLMGPVCAVCDHRYGWEDGRPMLIFPRNFGKVDQRLKKVFKMRLTKETAERISLEEQI